MKIYKFLIAFNLIICILLSMSFVAFADTSANNNEIPNQNEEIIVPIENPTNIGTTPEVEKEIIIEDSDIAHTELSEETVNKLKNSNSNTTQTEIIDEDVPFSATVEEDSTSNVVPLDDSPKTGDSDFCFWFTIFICNISLVCVVVLAKLKKEI